MGSNADGNVTVTGFIVAGLSAKFVDVRILGAASRESDQFVATGIRVNIIDGAFLHAIEGAVVMFAPIVLWHWMMAAAVVQTRLNQIVC